MMAMLPSFSVRSRRRRTHDIQLHETPGSTSSSWPSQGPPRSVIRVVSLGIGGWSDPGWFASHLIHLVVTHHVSDSGFFGRLIHPA